MLNKLRERRDDESGFTLIELLVVVLIIGILAAIALPSFLGQQAKGQDSAAKSDARNSVSQMESCYVDKQTYVGCDNAMLQAAGIDGVVVSGQGTDAYVITATSKSKNKFIVTKASGGAVSRSCTITGGTDKGGCSSGSW